MRRPSGRRMILLAACGVLLIVAIAVAFVASGEDSDPIEPDPAGEEVRFDASDREGSDVRFRSTGLTDLARSDRVVVTARATRTIQVLARPDRADYTLQSFIRGEALAGSIPREFTVRFFGGFVRTPDAVIPPDAEDPQFRRGRSYFLVLTPGPGRDWRIIGPAAGRYEVGRAGLEPVGTGPAQAALGGLSPERAAERIARAGGS